MRSSYFLSKTLPDKKILFFKNKDDIYKIDEFDIILLPNFMIPELQENSANVFFNSRSLSEMSRETVIEYSKHISRFTKDYILHENANLPDPTYGDHIEIPSYDFKFEEFNKVYTKYSPWSAGGIFKSRFVECLYQKNVKSS